MFGEKDRAGLGRPGKKAHKFAPWGLSDGPNQQLLVGAKGWRCAGEKQR
jgi:hypothetical protein